MKEKLILSLIFLLFAKLVNSQDNLITIGSLGLKGSVKKYRIAEYRASEKDGKLVKESLNTGKHLVSYTFTSSGMINSICRYHPEDILIDSTIYKLDTISNLLKGFTYNRKGNLFMTKDYDLDGELRNTFQFDNKGKLVYENSKEIDKNGRLITEKRFVLDNYNGLLLVDYLYNTNGHNIQINYSFSNDYETSKWSEKSEYDKNGKLVLEDKCNTRINMGQHKTTYLYEEKKLVLTTKKYCNGELIKETSFKDIGHEEETVSTYGQIFDGNSFKREVSRFNNQGLLKYSLFYTTKPVDSLIRIDTFIYDSKNNLLETHSNKSNGNLINQSKNHYENDKLIRTDYIYGNEIIKHRFVKPKREIFSYDLKGNLISKNTLFINNGSPIVEEFIIEYY